MELSHDGRPGGGVIVNGAEDLVSAGIKPYRVDTFKLSHDPRFEEKLVDVVGPYFNPPENAIVLAIETSQIQAGKRRAVKR